MPLDNPARAQLREMLKQAFDRHHFTPYSTGETIPNQYRQSLRCTDCEGTGTVFVRDPLCTSPDDEPDLWRWVERTCACRKEEK